ncbi:MAG: SoxR reducing system RseC family protein [Bacteroidales bacterium]
MAQVIRHVGYVKHLKDSIATVSLIVDNGACSACSVKSVCGNPTVEGEKEVEVKYTDLNLLEGEQVEVEGTESMRLLAVLLAYVLPFVMVLLALVVASQFVDNEVLVAVLSLFVLLPYYMILSTMRNKLQNVFAFRIIRKL